MSRVSGNKTESGQNAGLGYTKTPKPSANELTVQAKIIRSPFLGYCIKKSPEEKYFQG